MFILINDKENNLFILFYLFLTLFCFPNKQQEHSGKIKKIIYLDIYTFYILLHIVPRIWSTG